MSLADSIRNDYGGIDSIDYREPVSLPDGWGGFSQGVDAIANTASTLFGAAFGVASSIDNYRFAQQSRQLDLLRTTSAIDLQRTYTGAQTEIGKLQAQAAVNNARNAVNGDSGLTMTLANMNARIAGLTGGNNLMLYLAVAGVAFAALQYWKGR